MTGSIPATIRLYLDDDHCFEAEAIILAIYENEIAFDQTCFHPGGGGQPPDSGMLKLPNGESLRLDQHVQTLMKSSFFISV